MWKVMCKSTNLKAKVHEVMKKEGFCGDNVGGSRLTIFPPSVWSPGTLLRVLEDCGVAKCLKVGFPGTIASASNPEESTLRRNNVARNYSFCGFAHDN